MTRRITSAQPRFAQRALSVALALGWASTAMAAEVDVGNPDLKMRWDNTIRYNLGVRTQATDPRIIASSSYDESDAKFNKGSVVTNRLDLFSEMDLNYKGLYGARVSGAAWYDQAYDNHSVVSPAGYPTSYYNNQYNSKVSRYLNGPSAEFLDAFAWTNFNVGNVPVNVKLGRHSIVWGEGLFIGAHAISYSQAPVDGQKAVASPGIETKEVFLPLNQLSFKAQVTNDLTIAGQYFLEWKETRAPNGGAFLTGADTAPNVDRLAITPTFAADNVAPLKPRQAGNWGLSARMNVEQINSTVGLYYRVFNDYNPENGLQLVGFTGRLPNAFRFVYAQDTKLLGVSLARPIGPVSFGAEASYRQNASLNSKSAYVPNAGDSDTGARGDTFHSVVNGIYLLPKTALWDTGSFSAELAFSHLMKVTRNENLYRGVGYVSCTATSPGTGAGNESDYCSTKNFLQVAASLAPQYLGILPSWDLTLPLSVNYGIKGVAPSASGGAEKVLTWSLAANMVYQSRHEFTLRYAGTNVPSKYNAAGTVLNGGGASGGVVGASDRGWLVFTYKTSF